MTKLLFMLLLAGFSAIATAQGSISLKATALVETEAEDANGNIVKQVGPATRVTPGTEVIYRISFSNVGTQTASGLVINDPIPKGMMYVPGSAVGENTTPLVSVDNGSNFGQLAALTVTGADGQPRPATAEDVTNIRWLVNYPLAPSASGSVTFRAILQ